MRIPLQNRLYRNYNRVIKLLLARCNDKQNYVGEKQLKLSRRNWRLCGLIISLNTLR